jgi:hypothetical protein
MNCILWCHGTKHSRALGELFYGSFFFSFSFFTDSGRRSWAGAPTGSGQGGEMYGVLALHRLLKTYMSLSGPFPQVCQRPMDTGSGSLLHTPDFMESHD